MYQSNHLYKLLFENCLEGMFMALPSGEILDANPAMFDLLGYTRAELLRGSRNTVVDVEDMNLPIDLEQRASNGSFKGELTYVRKDGTRIPCEVFSSMCKDEDGRVFTCIIARDISERKRIEAELSSAHDRFKRCFDNILDCFAILQAKRNDQGEIVDLIYQYVNDVVCLKDGLTKEQLLGNGMLELFHDKEHLDLFGKYCQVVETGNTLNFESLSCDYEGCIRGAYDIRAIKLDDGIATSWCNITEKKRLHAEILKQARTTKDILNSIRDGFFSMDNEWRITYVNQVAEQVVFGNKKEILGNVLWDIIPNGQSYKDQCFKAKRENVGVLFEVISTNTETVVEVTAYPSPEGLSVLFRDVTERNRLEKELAKLDRFNLIGEMAASIGHEVRNPMTTVRGYLQMFQRQERFANYQEQIQTMIDELDRANSIITEFLSLAKDKRIVLKPTYLNAVVRKLLPLLQVEAISEGKEIVTGFCNVPKITVDEDEIRQCILNLTRNALDVVGAGGQVTLSTDWDGDNTVCLSVHDNGTGIPTDVLKNLGKPFVTTKDNGTGLGIPVCYRIAERHGAKIDVKTSPQGTTFTIGFKIN